jgi:hypothetical protein
MASESANREAIDLDYRRHGKKRTPAVAALTAATAATKASRGEAKDASNRAVSARDASNSPASAIVTAGAIEPAAITVSIDSAFMSLLHQTPGQHDRGENILNDRGKCARRAGVAASTSASVEAATGSSEAVPESGALVSQSLSLSPPATSFAHCFDAQSFRSRGHTDEGKKKLRLAFTTMCGIYNTVHGSGLVCKDSGEVVPELGKYKFSMLVARFPSYCENRYGKSMLGINKAGTFSGTVYQELVHVQKSLRKGQTQELFCLFKDICKLGDELIG